MQQPSNTELAAEFADYFQIEHQTTVNLVPFSEPLPDQDGFLRLIPDAFKMTSELSVLNNSSIRTFNAVKDLSADLAHYLQQQARKLDALTHYVLRSQDDPACRFFTFSYGGSGVQVWMDTPAEPGQIYEVKLFLDNNDGALFCLGQVLEAIEQPAAEPAQKSGYLVKILFRRIRDEDRDMVVRASLHEQSRQLKRKAEQRQLQAQQNQQSPQ